jgi:hypothetical protein
VDLAVQEWAFFGFPVVDRLVVDEPERPAQQGPRRRPRLPFEESARLASSIAGYWSTTPEGHWVLARQNQAWSGPDGVGERWQFPWSAAFVSWLMCEGGLGEAGRFQRAAAHHAYIDQAIRARRTGAPQSAFVAYDIGEAAVEPGDLLCSARRPAYRSLAERQQQMGSGARTHCDVVVQVEGDARRILGIGGNVRGLVSLKLLPAVNDKGMLRPEVRSVGTRGLSVFAHLKLRAPSIGADALERSPTIKALGCSSGFQAPPHLAAANLAIPRASSCAD